MSEDWKAEIEERRRGLPDSPESPESGAGTLRPTAYTTSAPSGLDGDAPSLLQSGVIDP